MNSSARLGYANAIVSAAALSPLIAAAKKFGCFGAKESERCRARAYTMSRNTARVADRQIAIPPVNCAEMRYVVVAATVPATIGKINRAPYRDIESILVMMREPRGQGVEMSFSS
jgi:hypothetical protein